MLTAYTKTGKKLCLGNEYKKETLQYFRKKEEFFCPICLQKVMMKLGDKRIFHFSHLKHSECSDYFENETDYHLQGKRQMYQWLKRQKIPAELEYYDKKIRQRPDVMFMLNGRKFALEFQCSTINQAVVSKRTHAYLDNSYTPLWILGEKRLKRHTNGLVTLSDFHYLFLKREKNQGWKLPFYCPETQKLIILHSLHPLAPQSALGEIIVYPLQKMTTKKIFNEELPVKFDPHRWKSKIRQVKMNCLHYPTTTITVFLNELYQNRLNLFLLPPEIGLPVCSAPFFTSSPIIWQGYLFIDLFQYKHPGEKFTIEDAKRSLMVRIKRKQIGVRSLPQTEKEDFTVALAEYMSILEKIGVLESRNVGLYTIRRRLKIPENMGEQQKLEDLFYQTYGGMLIAGIGTKKNEKPAKRVQFSDF